MGEAKEWANAIGNLIRSGGTSTSPPTHHSHDEIDPDDYSSPGEDARELTKDDDDD